MGSTIKPTTTFNGSKATSVNTEKPEKGKSDYEIFQELLKKPIPSTKDIEAPLLELPKDPSAEKGLIDKAKDFMGKFLPKSSEEKQKLLEKAPHNNPNADPNKEIIGYASGEHDKALKSAQDFANNSRLSDWESKGVLLQGSDVNLNKVEGKDDLYAITVPKGAAQVINEDAFKRFKDEGWLAVNKNS